MDNYNATLKALRNSIHMTRINQGADCELCQELEMWTKILDGVIKSVENDEADTRTLKEVSDDGDELTYRQRISDVGNELDWFRHCELESMKGRE